MTARQFLQELKYLNFADSLDLVRAKNEISPMEWRALRTVAKSYLKQQPTRIVDLMQIAEIGSPATIHKIIKNLTEKGLIEIQLDKEDGRIKYLIPSSRALKTFRSLASRMAELTA